MHGLFDDGKTQACACCSGAGGVTPEEGLGEVGQLVCGYAGAVVAHADGDGGIAELDGDVHPCVVGARRFAIAAGIFQHVGEHAREFDLIGAGHQLFWHGHVDLQLLVVLHGVDAGRHDAIDVDGGELGSVIGPRVIQEFVDGGIELHDVGHHVLAGHIVEHAHFGLQPQPRQRRTQVV
ncbi:hypothetical protein D3C72_1699470 [compost metagenome]